MPTAVPMINSGGGLNIAQLIQAITPLLGGTGTTTTGTTGSQTQGQTGSLAVDPAINALLTSLFGQVQGGLGGFTKEQAIADSQSALQNLARTAVEQNMPSVLGGAKAAGLYNSSTQDLLSNDLQSRIAAQGAQLIQDNIAKYAAITNQGQQTAASIGNTLAQGNRTQQQNNTQQTTQQQQAQTSPVIGGSAKNNALMGLGITAGGTALKNIDDLSKLFGGLGSTGQAAFDVGSVINPGNMLNAGYGIESGFGAAPSLGAALDLGGSLSNLGAASDGLSGLFTEAPAADTLSGVFNNVGSSAGTGIAGALSGGYDWLTDAFSGLGDFFGGFFANGGQVPSKHDLAMKFANGGLVEKGNIDLTKRPVVKNPDGSISTVRSMSVNFDGQEVLIPTVSPKGTIMTDKEAIQEFLKTGKHLGKFETPEAASKYAEELHNQQAEMYGDKSKYANGGEVTQRGAAEAPGRKGRAAYTQEAAGSRIYDISRALWEELQRGGEQPTLGRETQVVAPGVNEATPGIMPSFRGPDAQLQQVVDNLRSQIQARTEAAEPTRLAQVEKGALQAKGANQQGGRIIEGATGVSPATTLAAADLGGASSALSGSPIQQALQASLGTSGDLAAGAAGAGAGSAAASSAGLGTVDVLGSLGGNAFLPTYGAAASEAGLSGASGAFGGAAGTGGGTATSGLSSGLASTGVGAVAALLVNSFLPIIFGGFEGTKKSDDWIRAALRPEDTFGNQLIVGDMASNFFRDFYKGQGTGASTADRQSQYEAAKQAIASDAFTTYIPSIFSSTGEASTGQYEGYFGAEDEAKARAAANYLNDQLYNNPELQNQLTQNSPADLGFAPGALSSTSNPGFALGLAQGGYTYDMLNAEKEGLPYPGYTPSTGPDGAANGGMIGRNREQEKAIFANKSPEERKKYAAELHRKYNLKDGGEMPEGGHDPAGKADDILIHVSGGEYVVPKSVVDAIGPEFFDGLVDKFHIPFADRPPTR